MSTALATFDPGAIMERVVMVGDLSKLQPAERVDYYRQTCESLGLNPLTRPFEYITLNGKLTLYARKDATEQLRRQHGVSITIVARELVEGVYVVTARASTADGRHDESIGAVPVETLKGEARANAYMKAETKAKRRVTLSIVGLGWLDETEVSSIADARPANVDAVSGEIVTGKAENKPSGHSVPARADLVKQIKAQVDSAMRLGYAGDVPTDAELARVPHVELKPLLEDWEALVDELGAQPVTQAA
jgi:hypothetical protein